MVKSNPQLNEQLECFKKAAKNVGADTISALIDAGADVKALDENGKTPEDVATGEALAALKT